MAEAEVEQVEGKVAEVTPPPEATPQTYSQEEADALKAVALEEGKELGKKEEFDRINPILSQQGADLKKFREQPQPSRIKRDEIYLDEMKARATETGEPNPRIAILETELAEERKLDVEKKQELIRGVQETIYSYAKRTETAGLTEEDLDYWHIKRWVENGEYKPAELLLKKLEKEKKPVETKSKETEDEKVNRLVDEKLKAEMAKRDMLSTDTNLPSGTGSKKTYKLSELSSVEAQIATLPEADKKAARKDLLDAFKEKRVRDE